MQRRNMRQLRYNVVMISVILTLWSAARAKSLAGKGAESFYLPPPTEMLLDCSNSDDQALDGEIEQELASIEW